LSRQAFRWDCSCFSSGATSPPKQSSSYSEKIYNLTYTERDIQFDYDKLQRLLTADYGSRDYAYSYDRAGNRTQQKTTIGITTTTSG